MKIALVTPGFSAHDRDTCIPALRDLVQRLSTTCEVHVFTLRFPYRRGQYTIAGGQVHALGGGNRGGITRLTLAAAAMRAIAKEHRWRRFDVIHALWADEPGLIAVRAGRRLGIPVVVSLMGGELVRLPDIAYGAQLSRFARYAIDRALAEGSWRTAGSRYAMAQLLAHVPGREDRCSVVPFGTDIVRFCQEGAAAPGGPAILHVGSLTPIKDPHTLLRAFALVSAARPDVELRMIGDGPLRPRLERTVKERGLASRVRFLGEKPHDELAYWYRGATICALSSRHESQSVVALEAAACGVVTVGTAAGILPDLDPVCRTVPVSDHRALAAAMQELLDDAPLRHRLSAQARPMIERSYTIDHTARTFLDIYACLSGSGRRREAALCRAMPAEPTERATESEPALDGISFVIPAYNEEGSIASVIRDCSAAAMTAGRNYQVLVVDDGSRDGTANEVERCVTADDRVVLIKHPENLGIARAVADGCLAAKYAHIFYTDGDGQFDVGELDAMLPHAARFDFVVGYRVNRADPLTRRLAAAAYNLAVRHLCGVPIRDVNCAFKLMKRESVNRLSLRWNSAFCFAELMLRAAQAGMSIREVPIYRHRPRRYGTPTGNDLVVIARAMRDLAASALHRTGLGR
jgi:glycosyltransferase involved in cell wall biosynthesis